jgi:hypothetical protein
MRTASVEADGELVGRAAGLECEKFAARAERYDREASFPAEDFADLFRAELQWRGRTALARRPWAGPRRRPLHDH